MGPDADAPEAAPETAEPSPAEGYNLGRSGWVSAQFGPDVDPPIDILLDWIHESYLAVAPRRLAATVRPRD